MVGIAGAMQFGYPADGALDLTPCDGDRRIRRLG